MSIPQKPFYSTQDIVAPDVNLYYNKIIKEIDKFRSRFNGTTTNLSQSISIKKLDNVFIDNEANSLSPQESRCNAFYRMIGFPVVSSDGTKLYSPGFDPDLNKNKDRIQQNLDIATSALEHFKTILDAREIYSKGSTNSFQIKSDDASALAISSIYIRPFEKQFKIGLDPLQIDRQTFNVPARNNVSVEFEDVTFSTTSTHILKPFIVDPRIELTVTPGMNRICAPFLTDKSKTQLTRSNYLTRPYIERVISIRFDNSNVIASPTGKEEINQFIQKLIDFVQTNSNITNPSLVEITANSLQSLHKSELTIFAKFIKIIEALIGELVKSFLEIEQIRRLINWKPFPNIGGPEFGCTLNDVKSTDTVNNKKIETEIVNLQLHKFLEETNFAIGINAPDLANFSFSNMDDIIFDSFKNNSDFYDKQLTSLTRRREELGNKANILLQKIEIITGEFSGLGLLDIIAIQAALWVISPEALLGLIDNAAIERMQTNQELKTNPSVRLNPKAALTEFEKKLSEIYVLMNAFYQDIFNFDNKNK